MAVSFSRRSGSVWVQGSFSIVVFFLWQWDNTVPTSPSLSLFLTQVSPSLSSQRRSVRFLCWRPTKGKEEAWRGRAVWGQLWAPPSSLAIAALLSASWPSPAPGHSSGSHSEASGAARAPDPSTGSRPALRHCPGQSPSAWGQRKWEQEQASGVLNEKEENRSERNSVMELS